MFDILKKKLSKVVESISEKFEKKGGIVEEVPEIKEEIDKAVEEIKKKPKEKKSLLKKIKERIVKKITEKKLSEEDLNPILNELEIDLIESDVAYEVAEKIKNDLKMSLADREIKRGKEREVVVNTLKKSMLDILSVPQIDLEEVIKKTKSENRPAVLLFLGFNGSGKTTSLAKVGKWLTDKNYSCVFAAADTFRAGSEEQLEIHAKNIGVKLIKHKYGADPAAVVYDAIEHAKANGINFVLADSAGRAHTNRNLMDQMKKIVRVNKPDLKILVIDSLTGNDAVLQSRMFDEAGVDAVIFTKVDVNEKGGAILSVTHELKKPILFLGTGQDYGSFIRFDAEDFVNRLIGD